jgi:hypothetical protein
VSPGHWNRLKHWFFCTEFSEFHRDEELQADADCVRRATFREFGRVLLTSKRLIYKRASAFFARWVPAWQRSDVIIELRTISSLSELKRIRTLWPGRVDSAFEVRTTSGGKWTFQTNHEFFKRLTEVVGGAHPPRHC